MQRMKNMDLREYLLHNVRTKVEKEREREKRVLANAVSKFM